MAPTRIGYLGPAGSFSHEAVLTLTAVDPVPFATISDVLNAVSSGDLDQGLVPLENAIEGTVSATIDGLVFDHDLVMRQEIVLPIHLHLLAKPGLTPADVRVITSYGHALAQVRGYVQQLPLATLAYTTSTSQAAADVAATSAPWAAVGSALAGELCGLEVIAPDIADHPGNQTRFVVVGRRDIAPPSGNDRTAIVCFQDADRPGSLYGILSQFAARDINLTKLESRPTKKGLGNYCFVIEFGGHIADDIVADCLAELQAHLVQVKFLGSYPVTGDDHGSSLADITAARQSAEEWVSSLRQRITSTFG